MALSKEALKKLRQHPKMLEIERGLKGMDHFNFIIGDYSGLPTSVQATIKTLENHFEKAEEFQTQKKAAKELGKVRTGEQSWEEKVKPRFDEKTAGKTLPNQLPDLTLMQQSEHEWILTSLVLPILHFKCDCGHEGQANAGGLLLKRTHPKLGKHYQELKPGLYARSQLDRLPREEYLIHQDVRACSNCFKDFTLHEFFYKSVVEMDQQAKQQEALPSLEKKA